MNVQKAGTLALVCLTAALAAAGPARCVAAPIDDPLLVVVMDPLCDRLACDCVQGYAQRKYETLAKYLLAKTGKHSKIVFGESLDAALEDIDRAPDLVIGKYSVAVHGAKARSLSLTPVASLTGKDGTTTQSGLIVVRAADPALVVEDLVGYHVIFGPEDCDEKHAAPRELLSASGVEVPDEVEIAGACSDAARKLLDLPTTTKAAAVISSYAQPLLEGCGTIKKGDLRVVAETSKLPFVTVFANDRLDESTRTELTTALLEMRQDPAMLESLETKSGFVAFEKIPAVPTSAAATQAATKKN